MENSILGRDTNSPIKDDANPQSAPTETTYLAHDAPFNANTLGNAPPFGRELYGHIRVRTPDTPK